MVRTSPLPRANRAAPEPAERNKLHDAVVAQLEGEILSGQLPVGARLSAEAEIARQFAVSTRTVRDGLQVLETKGLIQRRHGECAVVVRNDVSGFLGSLAQTVKQLFSTDQSYFLQLMDVRRLVELDVVGQLAADGGALSAEVDRALDGMLAAAARGDAAGFTGHDAAFHLGLVHSTPNTILHLLYENLYGLITEVIQASSRVPRKSLHTAYAEHAEIRQLIADRNAEGARAAMAQHIAASAGYVAIALGKKQARRDAGRT